MMNRKAQTGLRPWVVNLVLVILFSFFITYFAIGFIQLRNPSSPILDSRFNESLTNLEDSLSDFSDVSNSIYSQLGESNPTATDYLFLMFKGAFYIPLTFLSFAFTGITNLANLLFLAFGGGLFGSIMTTVIGLITSGLLIALVLLIIKNIRTGASER